MRSAHNKATNDALRIPATDHSHGFNGNSGPRHFRQHSFGDPAIVTPQMCRSILDRLDADECREVGDVAVPVELPEVLDIAALVDVPVVLELGIVLRCNKDKIGEKPCGAAISVCEGMNPHSLGVHCDAELPWRQSVVCSHR